MAGFAQSGCQDAESESFRHAGMAETARCAGSSSHFGLAVSTASWCSRAGTATRRPDVCFGSADSSASRSRSFLDSLRTACSACARILHPTSPRETSGVDHASKTWDHFTAVQRVTGDGLKQAQAARDHGWNANLHSNWLRDAWNRSQPGAMGDAASVEQWGRDRSGGWSDMDVLGELNPGYFGRALTRVAGSKQAPVSNPWNPAARDSDRGDWGPPTQGWYGAPTQSTNQNGEPHNGTDRCPAQVATGVQSDPAANNAMPVEGQVQPLGSSWVGQCPLSHAARSGFARMPRTNVLR